MTPLAIIELPLRTGKVIYRIEELYGVKLGTLIWLKPPTPDQRVVARERLLAARGYPSDELLAQRMPLERGVWEDGPIISKAGQVSQGRDEIYRAVTHTLPLWLTTRIRDEAIDRPAQQPNDRERLSTWLARDIIPRLPPEDWAEVFAACVARKLNPDL